MGGPNAAGVSTGALTRRAVTEWAGSRSAATTLRQNTAAMRPSPCRSHILGQQLHDLVPHHFFAIEAAPLQFAVPPVADAAGAVDDVYRGPHAVAPRVPVLLLVVDQNGELEFGFAHAFFEALDVPFGVGFRRVDTDDSQTAARQVVVPTPVPGVIPVAVHSPERPEMNDHHLSSQVGHAERATIYPATRIDQLR